VAHGACAPCGACANEAFTLPTHTQTLLYILIYAYTYTLISYLNMHTHIHTGATVQLTIHSVTSSYIVSHHHT